MIDNVVIPETPGYWGTIQYAYLSRGRMPAKDFIEGLEKSDKAKLAYQFNKMAMQGKISNKQRFRKVEGKIWEFKCHPGIRVLCFALVRSWVLTHGYIKEGDKTPRREIVRANNIMNEHISLLNVRRRRA